MQDKSVPTPSIHSGKEAPAIPSTMQDKTTPASVENILSEDLERVHLSPSLVPDPVPVEIEDDSTSSTTSVSDEEGYTVININVPHHLYGRARSQGHHRAHHPHPEFVEALRARHHHHHHHHPHHHHHQGPLGHFCDHGMHEHIRGHGPRGIPFLQEQGPGQEPEGDRHHSRHHHRRHMRGHPTPSPPLGPHRHGRRNHHGHQGFPPPPPLDQEGNPLPPPMDETGNPLPPPRSHRHGRRGHGGPPQDHQRFPPPPPMDQDGNALPPPMDEEGNPLPPPGAEDDIPPPPPRGRYGCPWCQGESDESDTDQPEAFPPPWDRGFPARGGLGDFGGFRGRGGHGGRGGFPGFGGRGGFGLFGGRGGFGSHSSHHHGPPPFHFSGPDMGFEMPMRGPAFDEWPHHHPFGGRGGFGGHGRGGGLSHAHGHGHQQFHPFAQAEHVYAI